jgi:hypothetical protein
MGNTTMVRYTVKPEEVERNEALVKSVFDELRRTAAPGFHYATFVEEDGVSFVHLAYADGDGDMSPLQNLSAFQEYVKEIGERIVAPTTRSALREVDSYEFSNR